MNKWNTYLLVLPKHPISVLHSREFRDALHVKSCAYQNIVPKIGKELAFYAEEACLSFLNLVGVVYILKGSHFS